MRDLNERAAGIDYGEALGVPSQIRRVRKRTHMTGEDLRKRVVERVEALREHPPWGKAIASPVLTEITLQGFALAEIEDEYDRMHGHTETVATAERERGGLTDYEDDFDIDDL